jgi:penicillin-binding protein activator
MKAKMMKIYVMLLAAIATYFVSGCAAFRASTSDIDVNKPQHVDSTYDFSDLRTLSQNVADEMLRSPFLIGKPQPPIMMIAGVQNRTGRYVDTKGLTDKMRTLLFQSGKVQFVNEARREDLLKEQGYQAANATPETQTKVGRQLGAKYMMTGSLIEMQESSPRQVRVSKQEYTYYKLTIEVTDLETGLMAWTTEKEFARQASLPLIGW